MPVKLSKSLKDNPSPSGVAPTIREYEDRFRTSKGGEPESEENADRKVSDLYYDLVTEFYEYSWGRSFHFAPRVSGESFEASLARHELYLADVLELKPGMVVADLGCGPHIARQGQFFTSPA